ncbi:oleosin 16.4 kDa-like [Momordica charantia]|uniref:Oleosin 16.4 kDa-like n=1 Tax=Momordica charantia TaxID=3673 RepID=A0A6J1C9A5_MOMCH|nr:oleosin 16.4 kDa-like [Momordica charantia]
MADYYQQQQPPPEIVDYGRLTDDFRSMLPQKGSSTSTSTSHLVAVLTLLPVGASLLFLAGISFAATVVGLALAAPLLVIFSPILVPAALVIAFAVAGFLTSGAFGVTALSALSWMAQNLRKSSVPGQLEQAKRWAWETAGQAAQTAKDAGQAIQSKVQDGPVGEDVGRTQEEGKTEERQQAQEGERAQEQGRPREEEAQEGGKAREGGKSRGGRK